MLTKSELIRNIKKQVKDIDDITKNQSLKHKKDIFVLLIRSDKINNLLDLLHKLYNFIDD